MMRRLLARMLEPVSVMSTIASMIRALTSVAPQENSTRTSTPRAAKKSRVVRTSSVATTPPASCSTSVTGLSAGTASTQRAGQVGGAAVLQLGDLDHVGAGLFDPVVSGDADVDDAVLDIAGHLLGAKHRAGDVFVVDLGEVGAAVGGDLEAGPAEQVERLTLQRALGEAELQHVDVFRRGQVRCGGASDDLVE